MKSFQISREFDWPAWLNFLCLIPQHRAGILLYLIERAKKCLDFSATLYIIHLFICIVYGGWPSSLTWWIVNVTGLAVMALLGEYLCIKRELREIPITRYRSSKLLYYFAMVSFCLVGVCMITSVGCFSAILMIFP